MKVTVQIDCTPDEARTFCGFPDVKPMQQAVMAKMEKQMLDALSVMSPDTMGKMWSAFTPQNPEQLREAFSRFFTAPFGQSPPAKK